MIVRTATRSPVTRHVSFIPDFYVAVCRLCPVLKPSDPDISGWIEVRNIGLDVQQGSAIQHVDSLHLDSTGLPVMQSSSG